VWQSQAHAAALIESAMDAIISVDESHRIVLFNPAAEKMFGCRASDAINQPLDRFLPERFRATHSEHIRKFGKTSTTKRTMGFGQVFGLRSSGEEFPVEASISFIESGGKIFYTVILRDITQRQESERRLRELGAMVNQAQDAILSCDLEGRILFWNRGAERVYGWTAEEVLGKDISSKFYGGTNETARIVPAELYETGESTGEMRHLTRSGVEITVETHMTLVRSETGEPRSVLIINTDITEKKKLETQFLRAQRLESIGTLASGIAHDLNNILSPITMGVQLLQMKTLDEGSQRTLEIIRQSAERGSNLIKQVLSFARGSSEGQKTTLQTRHLIKEIVKILNETFPKNISIQHHFEPDLATISGDPTQLHQILMNLCVNARDAMPKGGTLTIESRNILLDPHYAQIHPDARPGQYILITVSDTGVGIPLEYQDRIFDPFFTTKEQGKGTGLGLATVLGIVKSHGGFINVYSEPGKGASFKIFLPGNASTIKTRAAEKFSLLPAGRGEVILVVDDEAHVREITRTTLETFGYRVLLAREGEDGLRVYAANKKEIALVLTDMMMPLMDGPTFIRALRKMNPRIPIIASSGLAEKERALEAEQLGVGNFLAKPYSAECLLKTIDTLLHKRK
jgi:PAS domain S-box-containing protein